VRAETERLAQRLTAAGGDASRSDVALQMSWISEGKGELTWDLTADRALSFVLGLESKVEVQLVSSAEGGESGFHFTLSAKSDFARACEVP